MNFGMEIQEADLTRSSATIKILSIGRYIESTNTFESTIVLDAIIIHCGKDPISPTESHQVALKPTRTLSSIRYPRSIYDRISKVCLAGFYFTPFYQHRAYISAAPVPRSFRMPVRGNVSVFRGGEIGEIMEPESYGARPKGRPHLSFQPIPTPTVRYAEPPLRPWSQERSFSSFQCVYWWQHFRSS